MHNLQKDVVVEPVKWGKKKYSTKILVVLVQSQKICPFKQTNPK